MRPPTSPIAATDERTAVRVCRGVMPSALWMPMSCARSRTSRTTALRTPRPATVIEHEGQQPGERVDDDHQLIGAIRAFQVRGQTQRFELLLEGVGVVGLVGAVGDRDQPGAERRPGSRLREDEAVVVARVEDLPDDGQCQGLPVVGEGERVADLLVGGPQQLGGDDGLSRAGEPAPGHQLVADPRRGSR